MPKSKSNNPIRWKNVIVLFTTPVLAFTLVPLYQYYTGFSLASWGLFAFYMIATGIAITAGYHRLWSHKAYKANAMVRIFLALFGSAALQNSILKWSADHRRHHIHVDDQDQDPYAATNGFWFSHIGWLLRDHKRKIGDFSNVQDLMKDKVVVWQHKYLLPVSLFMCFILPMLLGLIWGQMWGAFILCAILRLVLNHHFTFFINSLAHIWGKRPYTEKNTARDNGVLAFLTYGEGYHNYHHLFPGDYRNGIKWWQFDPTKWFIRACSWFKWTYDLKQPSRFVIEKAKLAKQFELLKSDIKDKSNKERLLEVLDREYQATLALLADWAKSKQAWLHAKKEAVTSGEIQMNLQKRYHALSIEMKRQKLKLKQWVKFKQLELYALSLQP